ncbi:hypothetical protein [Rhodococcus spelaei]|nr:hypothetical protein [Rhodococcus spelaei]
MDDAPTLTREVCATALADFRPCAVDRAGHRVAAVALVVVERGDGTPSP